MPDALGGEVREATRKEVADLMRAPDPDAELVARSKKGDLGAFEELVKRHQRPLFSYVYRMLGNPDDAEELTQVALVRSWDKLKGFKGNSKFKTWLYRIATNLCINQVTRRKPTTELPETLHGPETEEPEAEYRRRRREQVVKAAIECLPAEQRSALMLSVYDNMRYSEIARAMGKSVRAVDSLLFRAKANLRKNLAAARRKGIV
ncbi:MAG: RNA polymerase sigma factor [candidate division WOR-3 bacterium]|nr:MAG: RNA polymerase sigma factor [candidate division WOR-3 bacterium]